MIKNIESNTRKQKKIALLVFLCFLLGIVPNPRSVESENTVLERNENKISSRSAGGIQPNLTRTGYPIILNNETNQDIWDSLYGKDADDIRIAYYSSNNEWKLTAFQIDEKAYFRDYSIEMGYQATQSWFTINEVDITNWVHYGTDHRYVGSNIDFANEGYSEPNEWECIQSYWYTRQAEGNAPTDPVQADYQAHIDGWKKQIEHCIDWDDELAFNAENGKKASPYSWWNYESYPNRLSVEIVDPVDGGQSWMYIYYKNDETNIPPVSNYYIPPESSDLVSWDKQNMKITGETYESTIDPNNVDLDSNLRIKWPGLPANDLLSDNKKNWVSTHIHVYYDAGVTELDTQGDADVWREGQWDGQTTGYYNEKWSGIGYGLEVDLDLPNIDSGILPGQNLDYTDGHRLIRADGTAGNHKIDDGSHVLGYIEADQDNDGDSSEDPVPYLRGNPDFSGMSNEAAIDGPVRVILDRFQFQVLATSTSLLDYEEIWAYDHQTLKYYANMKHEDPYTFNLDFSSGDLSVWLDPYFVFFHTQRFSDFVTSDPYSYIMLGEAPDFTVDGIIPSFNSTQRAEEVRSGEWPYYLYPNNDGGTNDDFVSSTSSNGPTEGLSTSNSPYQTASAGLNPGSGTSNPSANNPLSDWYYLGTSSGGMWQYVPYQEYWNMFSGYNADNIDNTVGLDTKENRDLATYWRDSGGVTELGLYGHHADENAQSLPFERRTVFGNMSHWECQREYARMKYQLNENVTVVEETYPGGAIFEDTNIYINEELVSSGYPWVDNGDKVWIDCDMDSSYNLEDWSINDLETTIGYNSFTTSLLSSATDTYRIEFYIDDIGNKVPPNAGHNVRIEVASSPIAYINEEFYLDNTAPDQISDLSAVADYATVSLTWSEASDNGEVEHLEIYRNQTRLDILDPGITSWVDNNVLNNKDYEYFIRVVDKIGFSTDSNKDLVSISLQFDPAIPAELPDYFSPTADIDWTSNPGDTSIIDLYYYGWAEDVNNDGQADNGWVITGPVATSTKSFTFDPQIDDSTPQNGTYLFKVQSYDSDADVLLESPIRSSLYDDEDPIAGTIEDIVDEYYPDTAEIKVHWSGEFDALSGIDEFVLERDTGTSSAPDGSWSTVGTFDPTTHDYYDTNLIDNTWYWYRLTVKDAVGNSKVAPLEKVRYHAPSTGTATLKLSSITNSLDVQGRGIGNTFDVDVLVKNIGDAQGTVNDIQLQFTHATNGNMTHEYTIGTNPAFGTIGATSQATYTFQDIYAASDAVQGDITVDTILTWDTSNEDIGADNPDGIFIREFQPISFDNMQSDDPVPQGNSSVINMTITNPMVTQINLTDYSIDVGLDEGWIENDDYTLDSVIGPSLLNGYILESGEEATINFFITVSETADLGTIYVDGHAVGHEVLTDIDASSDLTSGIQFDCILPGDKTKPTIKDMNVNPNSIDPDSSGLLTITCNATDKESNIDFVGATIKNSSGNVMAYLELLDDGTHGDGANNDDIYGMSWDPTGYPLGTYTIDFNASDDSVNDLWRTVQDGASFSLIDNTGPTFTNPLVSPDPGDSEGGEILSISVDISDLSGVSSATATIQNSASVTIQTITLYDDGSSSGDVAVDGTWTGEWDCTGEEFGNYNIDFWAQDSSGSSNTNTQDNAITFDLADGTGPDIGTINISPDPADSDLGETVSFEIDLTDQSGVSSSLVYIENSTNDLIDTIILYNDGSTSGDTAVDDTWTGQWNCLDYPIGTYHIDVWAEDSSSDSNENIIPNAATFSLNDNTAPVISSPQINPTSGTVGSIFTITASIDDLSPISSVEATIELSDSYQETIIMYDDGASSGDSAIDGLYTGQWDSTGYSVDSYTISINATSNGYTSYANDFAIISLSADDTDPPTISNVVANPEKGNPEDIITISATISDGSGIFTPNITIGAYGPFDLIHQSGNLYSYDWDTTGVSTGIYDVIINATDKSSNNNEISQTTPELINITNIDFKNPQLSKPFDPSSYEVGNIIDIYLEVVDDNSVDTVIAYIQDSMENTIETIILTDGDSDNNYTSTWDTTGYAIGSYYIDYFANDTSGNHAALDNLGGTFSLTDTLSPSISNVQINATTLEYGEILEIKADVNDPSGILHVYCDIQMGNENTIATLEMADDGIYPDLILNDGIFTVLWNTMGNDLNGNYEIDIRAIDDSSANNQGEEDDAQFLNLQDTVKPSLTSMIIDSGDIEYPNLVSIQVDAYDLYGLDSVWATIKSAGNPVANLELTLQSGNTYSGQWDPESYSLDTYTIDLNATDLSTNPSYNLEELTGVSTVNIVDTTNPTLSSININPASIELGEISTIEVRALDNYGITSVYATITNSSSGIWLDGLTLVDGDNDNIYSANWNSMGFPLGVYNVSFNVTDMNGLEGSIENAGEITISIAPPSLTFDINDMYSQSIGFIGEDSINLNFTVQTDKPINITEIELEFWNQDTGIVFTQYFTLESVNISLPYELLDTDPKLAIEIIYSINENAPIVASSNKLQWNVSVGFEDQYNLQYTSKKKIAAVNAAPIEILKIPTIDQLSLAIDGTVDGEYTYLSADNKESITFIAEGPNYANLYEAEINLTKIGLGIKSLYWNDIYQRYEYTIMVDLPKGIYDCSLISVNISLKYEDLEYREANENYTTTFYIDTDLPIIYPETISIPTQVDLLVNNYSFSIELEDFANTNQDTISSGIGGVTITLTIEKSYDFQLVNLNGNLYGGSITTETLNSIGAEFNKMIQVSSIKVIDIAGNEITQTISNINSTIVDKTAPKMDWASLNLKISSIKKDNGNDMLLDADEYININLDIDDNGCYSSGIFYVRLFYNLNTDSSTGPQAAQSSSFQDWEYIEFIPLGNGSFYCVLSEEGKVGFNDGDEIDIIIMAMDFGNNNGTTEVLHMKFESEVDTTFSTSIMISMAIMVIGAITYRVKNRKIMKYISRGDEN